MKEKLSALALLFAMLCPTSVAFAQSTAEVKTKVLSVDMGQPGCAISVVDYYGGHLDSRMQKTAGYWVDAPPVHSTRGKLGVNFECQVGTDFDNAAQAFGASWDTNKNIWKLYYKGDDEKILSHVSRIYQLKSKNAVGFLTTTDQINGEEGRRVRFYSFCLFHNKAAVCGDGQSMKLEDPKSDYLPYILRILRGVSFIDTPKDDSNR